MVDESNFNFFHTVHYPASWDPIFSGNLKEEWRDEAAYLSLIESSYYDHYLMNHLFFIYLRSDCEVPCHNQLSSMFPMKR